VPGLLNIMNNTADFTGSGTGVTFMLQSWVKHC
jgi:hypothetical protein